MINTLLKVCYYSKRSLLAEGSRVAGAQFPGLFLLAVVCGRDARDPVVRTGLSAGETPAIRYFALGSVRARRPRSGSSAHGETPRSYSHGSVRRDARDPVVPCSQSNYEIEEHDAMIVNAHTRKLILSTLLISLLPLISGDAQPRSSAWRTYRAPGLKSNTLQRSSPSLIGKHFV